LCVVRDASFSGVVGILSERSEFVTISLGIVGCGDVAFRTYLPGLRPMLEDGSVCVAVLFDPVRERAERAAALFPDARAVTSLEELLRHPGLDVGVNLTPAPLHREVTAALLEAGLHVFTEKPIAGTVAEAQALIALAERQGKLLFSAPAVMATGRFRWLKRVVEAGKIGRPTLVTAQMANMGPAAWRAYTGDPAVFYSASVGPLIDTGVYVLHAATGLLGPAKRVQAFGGTVIPKRTVLVERLLGQEITVETADQLLIHLDFGDNVFAQIHSSFATPRTKAPAFELHGTGGSISISTSDWYNANGATEILIRDDSPLGVEDWQRVNLPTPTPYDHLIAAGVPQLVACLRGEEAPILTAEHATHVLEIMLAAQQAAGSGETISLNTTF
jgi:predicted dehydrogenase